MEERKVKIYKNKQHNGLEIYPNSDIKESEKLALEIDGWTWHKLKHCFYANATKRRYQVCHNLFPNIPILELDKDITIDKHKNDLEKAKVLALKMLTISMDYENTTMVEQAKELIKCIDEEIASTNNDNSDIPPMPF